MSARILQINTSRGGVPKRSEPAAMVAPGTGIESDSQADQVHHGGPDQDLLLFRLETVLELQREGHPIYPGAVGENLTVAGAGVEDLVPGTRLLIAGEIEIELTRYAPPCHKIAGAFVDGNFNRINAKLYPEFARIYARVLTGGTIRPGDLIEPLRSPSGYRAPDSTV